MTEQDRHWKLMFDISRSSRYHMRRQAFYDLLHRSTSAIGVIFGSATMASLFGQIPTNLAVAFAGVVTVFSAIDLVVGTAAKSRLHHDLRKRFLNLEKKLSGLKGLSTEQDIKFKKQRLEIEANEPPIMRALDTICHNDLAHYYELDDAKVIIPWIVRLSAQFINWDCTNLKKSPSQTA